MLRANSRARLAEMLAPSRAAGLRVGLVPTMGNLHDGHISLVRQVREHCDYCVASIYVNPTQFGEGEDLDRYPRTPDADFAALNAAGCDLVFMPGVEDVYPDGPENATMVHVPVVSEGLCGAARPGHFDGVATVVSILLSLVRPQVAIFGRKDFQQLKVIEKLERDLGLQVNILGAPIVREKNGLAMSSRNQYLSAAQRDQAAVIFQSLRQLKTNVGDKGWEHERACAAAIAQLQQAGLEPEYLEIRCREDLSDPGPEDTELVALAAARLGGARLIDNLEFDRSHF